MKHPYPVQLRAATHLYEREEDVGILPMGFGKTMTALTAAQGLIEDHVVERGLVLAPKRVAQLVWPKEPEDWPHLASLQGNVVAAVGDAATRRRALRSDAPIVTCNFDVLPWLLEELDATPSTRALRQLLMIDELSGFKAPRGKRQRKLSIQSELFGNRWGLTGTPSPNGLIDLFAPLKVITKGALWGRNFDKWRELYFMALDYGRIDWQLRPEWRNKLLADIATIGFSVDPADLPPDVPVRIEDVTFDMPAATRVEYQTMLKHMVSRFGFPDDAAEEWLVAANAAVAAGKLAQITSGFAYDTDVLEPEEEGDDPRVQRIIRRLDNERMTAFERVNRRLGDRRAIVVYEFKEELAQLRQLFPDAPAFGDGLSDAEAARHERDWNAGKVERLLLHAKSGGHGLNLQKGGYTLVFYALPWSYELTDQVIHRIARTGQSSDHCHIIRLLCNNSVDQAKVHRHNAKAVEQALISAAFPRV